MKILLKIILAFFEIGAGLSFATFGMLTIIRILSGGK
jgi:hypothetical protein